MSRVVTRLYDDRLALHMCPATGDGAPVVEERTASTFPLKCAVCHKLCWSNAHHLSNWRRHETGQCLP